MFNSIYIIFLKILLFTESTYLKSQFIYDMDYLPKFCFNIFYLNVLEFRRMTTIIKLMTMDSNVFFNVSISHNIIYTLNILLVYSYFIQCYKYIFLHLFIKNTSIRNYVCLNHSSLVLVY